MTVLRGVSRPSGSTGAAGSVLAGGAADVGSWAAGECAAAPTNRKIDRAMRRAQGQVRDWFISCRSSLGKGICFVRVARDSCLSARRRGVGPLTAPFFSRQRLSLPAKIFNQYICADREHTQRKIQRNPLNGSDAQQEDHRQYVAEDRHPVREGPSL